jgi:hypothetical protein
MKVINEGFYGILAFKMSEITLNDAQVFNELDKYLTQSTNLIDLDLSGCGLLSTQLETITLTLIESET